MGGDITSRCYSEDGSFDMFMRLCGDINPAHNGECFQFPDDFYELWIDEVSLSITIKFIAKEGPLAVTFLSTEIHNFIFKIFCFPPFFCY